MTPFFPNRLPSVTQKIFRLRVLVNVINCWGTSTGQHHERISTMIAPPMFSLNWMDSGQIWFHHLNVNVDFEAANQLVVHAFYMTLHPIRKNYLMIFNVIWVQVQYSTAYLGVLLHWPTRDWFDNRVFHKLSTVQECENCQLCFTCAIRNWLS